MDKDKKAAVAAFFLTGTAAFHMFLLGGFLALASGDNVVSGAGVLGGMGVALGGPAAVLFAKQIISRKTLRIAWGGAIASGLIGAAFAYDFNLPVYLSATIYAALGFIGAGAIVHLISNQKTTLASRVTLIFLLILGLLTYGLWKRTNMTDLIRSSTTAQLKQALEDGEKVNVVMRDGTTPLIMAIVTNLNDQNTEKIRLLLEHGADVNYKTKYGYTPWLHAVTEGAGNQEVLLMLISHGADVHQKDRHGQNALHLAAVQSNSSELINHLLDLGIDPNEKDDKQMTPLKKAELHGRKENAKALLEKTHKETTIENNVFPSQIEKQP